MQFQTAAQQATYERIRPWMTELFGEGAIAAPDRPVFFIPAGSAVAQLAVSPWSDDEATISCRAYVVSGATITPELMSYLLHENATMRFGAFGIDSEDDIFFGHTIVGSTCDKPELKATTFAVAFTADRYDDEIIRRWGGKTALDQIRLA